MMVLLGNVLQNKLLVLTEEQDRNKQLGSLFSN